MIERKKRVMKRKKEEEKSSLPFSRGNKQMSEDKDGLNEVKMPCFVQKSPRLVYFHFESNDGPLLQQVIK